MVGGHEFNAGSTSYFYPNSSHPLTSALAWHTRPSGLEDPLQSSNTLAGSSSAPSTVTPDPGSSPGQAFNLGNLNGSRTVSDFVGNTDLNDFYRFDLSAPSSLNIALSGLSADANLQLLNSTGTVIASSSQVGNLAESINLPGLTPGTYYAKVYQFSGDTNYNLKLTADLAGNTLSTVRNIGSLSGTQMLSDFVGTSDPNDYYQLNLSAPGSLNIALNGLSADANLQLLNRNGTLIASSAQVGNLAESINLPGLAADTYYVRVYQVSGDTNCNLKLTADLAGNTLSAARNIGSLSGTQILRDFVGTGDPNDYYQLNLSTTGSLNVALNGLSADANLQVFNSSGTLIGSSSQVGNLTESINLSGLAADTYYVRVYQSSGDTNYCLNLSTSPQSEVSQSLLGATNSNNVSAPTVSTSSPLSTIFSVVDASGDNTPYTVFQGGAIRVSYDFQSVTSLSYVQLEALSSTGLISTLATWSGASLSSGLVNLASFSSLIAGDCELRAVIHTTDGKALLEATQAISVLPNNRFNGTLAADTFEYSVGMGKGAIFLGRGGTDTLDLGAAGIYRANVTSINGLALSAFDPLSGVPLSQLTANQAIYGGTAFDYITLADSREIYFQGIEFLHFADQSIQQSLELQVHPNDTYFGSQWNLAVSDVPSAWRFTQGASNVLLVSLDTGLAVGTNGLVNAVDIATNRLTSAYWPWANDDFNDYGHGQAAINIMAGTANNNSGIAGINWNSPVYVNDVYGGNGAGWRLTLQGAIQNAITYARANNMKVVFQGGIQGDLWLNDGGTQAQLEQLIQANADIATFAIAAGNGGPGGNLADPNYLTSVSGVAKLETTYSNVMSVGALQYQGTTTVNGMINATAVDLAAYSNRGSNLTLVAPTDSPVMDKFGNWVIFNETSAANPNLAGIASLVWSVNSTLTGGQIRQILTDTAMDLGTMGRDNTFGYGLVNADAAVRRAEALQLNAEVANLYAGSSLIV